MRIALARRRAPPLLRLAIVVVVLPGSVGQVIRDRGVELRYLGNRAQRRDARIEVRPEAHQDVLRHAGATRGDRAVGRDAEIAGQIEEGDRAVEPLVDGADALEVLVAELLDRHGRALDAVVPPQRHAVALDDLEQALEDRLLARVAGGGAVRARDEQHAILVPRRGVVQLPRRDPAHLAVGEGPHGRPVDGQIGGEPLWHEHEPMVELVPPVPVVELRIRPQHDVVGVDGARSHLVERPRPPSLLARVQPLEPLHRLTERADAGLGVGHALARALVAQTGAELAEVVAAHREVVPGCVDVHRRVVDVVDARERADGARDRADLVLEPLVRRLGRHRPRAAVVVEEAR